MSGFLVFVIVVFIGGGFVVGVLSMFVVLL